MKGERIFMLRFDEQYYQDVILKHHYNPMEFNPIDFHLNQINSRNLRYKWLCHYKGDIFANALHNNKECIVTTGIGLSGVPHLGTLSQILRAIFLQKNGLKVQIVLGDLDSYNARNQPLEVVIERAEKYKKFIKDLGFDTDKGILRTQYDNEDVLKTAYLISNVLMDKDFKDAEEDLSELYKKRGIYPGIEFPVKMAILLMTADFIHLGITDGYSNILIILGLEEHLYVQIANKVIERMKYPFSISSMYSRIIKGFNGYPKMSKSIPESSITVDMPYEKIYDMIVNQEGDYENPIDSVVYQMMCAVSYYSPKELDVLYEKCKQKDEEWIESKKQYVNMLFDICSKWNDR